MNTTTLGEGDRAHRYTRILQSYRDAEGKPRQQVLARFKDLPELAERNLKAAIAASRCGHAVVVAEEVASELVAIASVAASLRYLDVAVALRTWESCGLTALLESVLPRRDVQMAVAEVIAALTVHRCVSPGSKLDAARWYPRTALPELQRTAPERFNNSRVHRALEALDEVDEQLQQKLSAQLHQERGKFAALFLDTTDTWFEGHGPELAANGRTKEGTYKRRIGIALLCDERGLPLRWATLSGRYHEADAMQSMVEQVSELDWVRGVPLVMDRGMGRAQSVEFLGGSGVQFVTAIPVDEFASHTDAIPYQKTAEIVVAGTDGSWNDDLTRVRAAAERAGYTKVSDRRYVLDLGTRKKSGGPDRRVVRRNKEGGPSRVVAALELARSLGEAKRSGRTSLELATLHGTTKKTVNVHLRLLRLDEALQERVLRGDADGATLGSLEAMARLPVEEQGSAFERLCEETQQHPSRQRHARWSEPEPPVELRYVVHFNPERFVEQRRIAAEQERELEAFASDLNRRLASPSSRRTEASIRAEIDRELRKKKLLTVFDVTVEAPSEERPHYEARLARNEAAWKQRRRYDGINLFVASPSLNITAADLVELYFAKDVVEKDFGTIKGVVELRPVRHRTDPKVRAHVTLCMLALLLERTLERMLADAGIRRSAPDVFETLSDCRLNILQSGSADFYTVTRPTDEQREIIGALGLEEIATDTHLRAHVRPRA